MQEKTNQNIFFVIRKIPIFGSAFRIANSYAYEGKYISTKMLAPLRMWFSRILCKVIICLLFSIVIVWCSPPITNWNWSPASTLLSSFPSILGFGIGAYALLFVMPNSLMRFLDKRKQESSESIGSEMLQVDMAYPLLVFIIVMFIGLCGRAINTPIWEFICFWALVYGLAITLELASFLFNTSMVINKLRAENK